MENTTIKRSGCLTIFLALILAANLFLGGYFVFTYDWSGQANSPSLWLPISNIIVCLVNIACAVGIWKWRKWGLIGFCLSVVFMYVFTVVTTGNYANIFGLTGASVLALLVSPYWKQMKFW